MSTLAPADVSAALQTVRYGRSLAILQRTQSTNDDARQHAVEGAPDGHVVTAEAQDAGRGSQGRTWSSPAGTDLYVSIVDRPALAVSQLPPLTLAVGLGVADTVSEALSARGAHDTVRIKWPNDVWVGERKCAGILVEATTDAAGAATLVIGIGLNVNRTEFDPALADLATSLKASAPGGGDFDRAAVLGQLLTRVEQRVDAFVREGSAPTARAVNARLRHREEPVECGGVRGTLLGIAASGALRIETPDGVREVVSGRLTSAT